jgi:hypothetical protein
MYYLIIYAQIESTCDSSSIGCTFADVLLSSSSDVDKLDPMMSQSIVRTQKDDRFVHQDRGIMMCVV